MAAPAQAALEGRRERRKRELHARIYDTARQLFLARGFEATTVEQIAEAADIAPATFFNHFQSKHALLGEMTSEVFEHLRALIDEHLLRPGPVEARIRAFIDQAAKELNAARGLARDVLLELMRTPDRAGGAGAVPYLARVHAPFTAVLREGQRKGEVRADTDAAFLAEMVVGAFNATIINWLNDPHYPLERRLRQAAVFAGEAIRPPAAPRRAGR
jgi:AcrR family transcriptional regulator